MAAVVGKYAANKLLKKHMSKYEDKKVSNGDVRVDPPPLDPYSPSLPPTKLTHHP
jgi:hypothetical protein